MQYVEGNILRLEKGLIIHQVNCHGVMSKGASGSIQTKWPRVFEEYVKACEKLSPKGCLGCVQFVDVTSSLVVANSFSQLDYGDPRVTGEVYTDVDKLVENIIYSIHSYPMLPAYVPYGIGAGWGGASWPEIEFRISHLNVNVMRLPKGGAGQGGA